MSRTQRRLIPSPAMIVALVALIVSLGSSGYAQIVPAITGEDIINNSVTGKDIRNTSVTRKDIRKRSLRGRKFELNSVGGRAIKESRLETVPNAGGLEFWAVVNFQGVLTRGRGLGAGDASRTSPGIYQVIFNRNVRSCSYQATIGSAGTAVPAQDSQITVSAHPLNDNAVLVRTANGTNTEADRAFQLAVIC